MINFNTSEPKSIDPFINTSHSSSTNFDCVPPELLEKIFSFLTQDNLGKIPGVCKRFREISIRLIDPTFNNYFAFKKACALGIFDFMNEFLKKADKLPDRD